MIKHASCVCCIAASIITLCDFDFPFYVSFFNRSIDGIKAYKSVQSCSVIFALLGIYVMPAKFLLIKQLGYFRAKPFYLSSGSRV